jgi:hypothetical protein
MPNSDSGKADLLDHLAATLPHYIDILNITAEEVAAVKADADAFRYGLKELSDIQAYAQHWTTFKNLLRDGGSDAIGWPVPPVLALPIPNAVSFGIIPRLSSLVGRIKSDKNYTTAIGQDLWLIGASQVIDPSTWKPTLNIQSQAGHPIIAWTKGKAAALEIWVDRGDGSNFVFLTINTEPNTTDTTPLPSTSAVWKYKAIYRLHDEQVGQWSDVISVTVSA